MSGKIKIVIPKQEMSVEIGGEFQLRGSIRAAEAEFLLFQAIAQPEVFGVCEGQFGDRKKHWVQDPPTFTQLKRKYGLSNQDIVRNLSVQKLNALYETGDTILWDGSKFIVGKRARDIYYSAPLKPYMFKGMRALLTLNPVPTNAQIVKDLGFNTIIRYTNKVSGWDGDEIRTVFNPQVKYLFTSDEPDCNKRDPQTELQLLQKMKEDNPNIPVGFCLCQAIGCGLDYCGGTVQKTIDAWMEVANQADFVMCGVYAYRKGVNDPLWDMNAKWERYYNKLTVPFLPLLQAHWWDKPNEKGKQVLMPEIMPQLEFWFDRAQEGYENISGYGVYCWADRWHGVRDMQNEWEVANTWAKNNV